MSDRRLKSRIQRNKKIARMKKQRAYLVCGLVFVCFFAVCGIVYGGLRHYVNRFPQNRVLQNVYIGTLDVSGMKEKEARQAVDAHHQEHLGNMVTMGVGEKSAKASLGELGLKYKDADQLVKQAMDYGKKGSVVQRFRKIRGLSKEKHVVKEAMRLDPETAKAVIDERAVPLTVRAENAYIERTGEGSFSVVEEKEGYTVDVEASIESMEQFIEKNWDHEDLSVDLTLVKEEPKIKAADLATIEDELGSFSTDAGGGDRWQNLSTGVGKLNGTILMPGESLSVCDATAPYDAEHGYVEAGSYENGQVVDSYGGGICQVSTTLYNAVLYAELQVDKRYPHSMLVNYVKPSRDAAIAEGILDFVFTNNYDTPIYIAGEIDAANQMRFTIYGKDTRPEGRTVEYESETLETEEYSVVYKEDAEAALGSMEYSGSPHTGTTAQLWKVVYQDGVEESREVINQSVYEKSDQIILVGTASDDPAKSKIVRDAIASQDQAQISAAISQAQSL